MRPECLLAILSHGDFIKAEQGRKTPGVSRKDLLSSSLWSKLAVLDGPQIKAS